MSGKSGRGVSVEKEEVCKVEGIFKGVPTSRRAAIACLREPRGAVGSEVRKDKSIILGGKK